jgi:hypothetical protein
MLYYRTGSSGWWGGWLLPAGVLLSRPLTPQLLLLLAIIALNTALLSLSYFAKPNLLSILERLKLSNIILSATAVLFGLYVSGEKR